MDTLTYHKAITVRYLSPTDYKGARLKAYDGDKNSITIPYPHHLPNDECYLSGAKALMQKMEWQGNLIGGWQQSGQYVFLITE